MSQQLEVNDYSSSQRTPLSGKLTRAVVVSNKDPQFAGRVKVWIPTIHGNFKSSDEQDVEDDIDDLPPLPAGACHPGNLDDPNVIETLPWAKCLGANWGPRQNNSGAINISGVFSTPKKGTEVFVLFENNDPNLPVVTGAIFHSNEFSYSKFRPVELFPGQEIMDSSANNNRYTAEGNLASLDTEDYEAKSANAFSIRGENDSMLYISDDTDESYILLSGLIKLSDRDTLTDSKATAIKAAYPGFPTTASAAYTKRVLLSDTAFALPDPGVVNYQPPFDQIHAPTATIVTSTDSTPPLPGVSVDPNVKVVKQWPVMPSPGQTHPTYPHDFPQGNFGAPRPQYRNAEKKHVGLDIVTASNNSTILLAPIDMKPLYYAVSESAGVMLLCRAIDGTGHSFLHLYSVFPSIISLIRQRSSDPNAIVKAGTQLGYCGNTGSSSKGAHLHWEVFKGAETATAQTIMSIRQAAISKGTSQFYNPINWIGQAANSNTVIQGNPDQMRSWIDHQTAYANSGDVNYAKPIGLEISTTPGQEFIYLRHPSGAFVGFDCDGNYQMFTPGDANHRVNRSWNLDVFGGILEVCYTKFTRVRTLIQTWAKSWSNMSDKTEADNSYPDFFVRAQKTRKIDMLTALRSTLGNAFYTNSSGETSSVSDAIPTTNTGMSTPANPTERDVKNNTYDDLIKTAYNKYITGNLKLIFPDWKWFKAQMLLESNADPNAKPSEAGSIGLFQITQTAVEDVLKYKISGSEFNQYYDPKKNIEIGVQLAVKNYGYVQSYVNIYTSRVAGATPFASLDAEQVRRICFFSYNVGPTQIRNLLRGLTDQTITYSALEAAYKNRAANNRNTQVHLEYVPTLTRLYSLV